jgi:hypothetical protein
MCARTQIIRKLHPEYNHLCYATGR